MTSVLPSSFATAAPAFICSTTQVLALPHPSTAVKAIDFMFREPLLLRPHICIHIAPCINKRDLHGGIIFAGALGQGRFEYSQHSPDQPSRLRLACAI